MAKKLDRTLRKLAKRTMTKEVYFPFWYLEMHTGEPYIWVGKKKVPRNAKVPEAMGRRVLTKHGIHHKESQITSGTLRFIGGRAELHVLRRSHAVKAVERLVRLAAKHDHLKTLHKAKVVAGQWKQKRIDQEVAESAAEAAEGLAAEAPPVAPDELVAAAVRDNPPPAV